jgi:hypothetical protein
MKPVYPFTFTKEIFCRLSVHQFYRCIVIFILIFGVSFLGHSQNGNGNGNGNKPKDLVIRTCTTNIGNGLFSASFSYDNPTNQDINVSEDDSFVKYNNGNNKTKSLNKFKKGNTSRAFTKEFKSGGSVEWTVIQPNGKIHTVVASANSSHCTDEEKGIIFPVYDQGSGKTDQLIGLDLIALAEGNAGDIPTNIIYRISDTQKVLIEIIPLDGKMSDLLFLLMNTYGLQFNVDPNLSDFIIDPQVITADNLTAVDVFFPIANLLDLNSFSINATDPADRILNFVRPLYDTYNSKGIVTSQGDKAQKSETVKAVFRTIRNGEVVKIDGTGVMVGGLSDSFDAQPFTGKTKAAIDVENGDLPGANNPNGYLTDVQVIKDFPYGESSDEGRAMLQIVHDVAPGAELAFYTGVISPRDFELGIKALKDAGVTLMFDDITFPGSQFFGEGRIAQAIKEFTSIQGNAYVTSAGNFANNAHQNIFNPSTDVPVTNFLDPNGPTRAHVFGTNADGSEDVLQQIHVVPGTYMIVLQWDEDFSSQLNSTGAIDDLDIYLVDNQGRLVVGNNRVNEAGDPTEFIVFQATGEGDTNIMITSANGPPPPGLSFRYIAFRSAGLDFIEYAGGAPTVSGHAMTNEAITVGAVDYRVALNPISQSFSSFGGTLPNAANLEIDFSAPDGVNTNVGSIGQDINDDEDNFPNFFGTSAAAPHAIAAFALLESAAVSWYPQGLPTAPIDLFKQTAVQFGNIDIAGAGLLDVASAFSQIAAPTANLTQLLIEDGLMPSAEPFEVTILGTFLPSEPTIIFDGQELEIVSVSDTEIKALVGTFSGNPPLVVNTPSITPGGTDGGDSDPIFFFDDGKIAINIIAEDVSAEFGQDVTFSYSVEGLEEGVTYESLGLPEVKFSTPAVFPYPDVNNYIVTPYFDIELTPEQIASFQVNFINGILTITKKDLTIQPIDTFVTYGDAIVVPLSYDYDVSGISDNPSFLSAIETAHETDFFPDNTIIFINKFRGVVNEQEILNLMNNGSWMASERFIQNKFRAVVNGMNVVDLEVDNFNDYINAQTDPLTNKFRAVVNKFRAVVNGEDLLDNLVDLVIENKFRAVVNETGLGDENDNNDYSSIFAIIDQEDGSTETEERTIDKLYSLNLLTGLDVDTDTGERQYVFPGALLAPIAANFNITYGSGRISILPATLQVTTLDLLINQGEVPDPSLITSQINGYVYQDDFEGVFPEGLEYIFENAEGEVYQVGDIGVFDIKIIAPQNYDVTYIGLGKLYVNPYGTHMKKIRNYLDCIVHTPNDPSGFDYIAKFRYDNPNDNTLYVLRGVDNYISGDAQYSGELPFVFLPGEGTIEILFDGNVLRWNLTTFESTHKTSTWAEGNLNSTKCSGGIAEGDPSYTVFPNPVQTVLTIQQNDSENSDVDIYNLNNGVLYHHSKFNKNGSNIKDIDMTSFANGIYIIKITVENVEKIYTIIKTNQ